MNYNTPNNKNIFQKFLNFPKLKFILPLILTLSLFSCHKDKDPNYEDPVNIEASDATPELKEIKTQLENFEKTYENFYPKATTEEQKIALTKIQTLITKATHQIKEIQGTIFKTEYEKKIAEINITLQEIERQLNLCTLKFGRTCYLINNNSLYLELAA